MRRPNYYWQVVREYDLHRMSFEDAVDEYTLFMDDLIDRISQTYQEKKLLASADENTINFEYIFSATEMKQFIDTVKQVALLSSDCVAGFLKWTTLQSMSEFEFVTEVLSYERIHRIYAYGWKYTVVKPPNKRVRLLFTAPSNTQEIDDDKPNIPDSRRISGRDTGEIQPTQGSA